MKSGRNALPASHTAVAARVFATLDPAFRMPDERAGMTHALVKIIGHFDRMAHLAQLGDDLRGIARLQLQRRTLLRPGPAEQPARRQI